MEKDYDDEINLFELFQKLWAGKWKIISITFIFALMGIGFSINKPNSFHVSTNFKESPRGSFIRYMAVNDILFENGFKLENDGYFIDSTSVFQMVINEFNDYNEIKEVLMKDELINESIKDLNESEKRKAYAEMAKSYKIVAPSKNNTHWSLSFEWNDINNGQKLFEDAMLLVLRNVKKRIIEDVRGLGLSIDLRTKREIDTLKLEISLLKQNEEFRNKKYLRNLSEQADIARALGIENNQLDTKAFVVGLSSNEVPLYTRGFKAIEKEISLNKDRSPEETLLMTSGYLEMKERLDLLENSLTPTHLKNALQAIERDNPDIWVDFDFSLSNSKLQKNSKIIVALSIVLGGMIGIIYVIISNVNTKRKIQLDEVKENLK